MTQHLPCTIKVGFEAGCYYGTVHLSYQKITPDYHQCCMESSTRKLTTAKRHCHSQAQRSLPSPFTPRLAGGYKAGGHNLPVLPVTNHFPANTE